MPELTLNERCALAMGHRVSDGDYLGYGDETPLPNFEIPEGEVPDDVIANIQRLVDRASDIASALTSLRILGGGNALDMTPAQLLLSKGLKDRRDAALEVLENA